LLESINRQNNKKQARDNFWEIAEAKRGKGWKILLLAGEFDEFQVLIIAAGADISQPYSTFRV